MDLNIFQAINVEYAESPTLKFSVDGQTAVTGMNLPGHSTFKSRRLTLPKDIIGYIPHVEVLDSVILQNSTFEAVPIESFNTQQLFHYFEFGYRTGSENDYLTPRIYLDGEEQSQVYSITTDLPVDTIRIYFDPLAYGFIPHIHNVGSTSNDAEILWARPVALSPRFYRGVRTHSEFQITFRGDVNITWFLDGEDYGTYQFDSDETTTKKDYFQSGTIGHVLQYRHNNPGLKGKIYMVETDTTMADLEQEAMRTQLEG